MLITTTPRVRQSRKAFHRGPFSGRCSILFTKIIKNCKFALYADDIVLYISSNDFNSSVTKMQEDINGLLHWCTANGILTNTDKTKIMVFVSKNNLAKLPAFDLQFGLATLQKVTSYTYLGITLDNQLNYNAPVTKIIGSVTSKLNQFRRMRNFLTVNAALLVYKGMLLPPLEYGDIFLAGATAANKKRLQVLQNKGLCCALNKDIVTTVPLSVCYGGAKPLGPWVRTYNFVPCD